MMTIAARCAAAATRAMPPRAVVRWQTPARRVGAPCARPRAPRGVDRDRIARAFAKRSERDDDDSNDDAAGDGATLRLLERVTAETEVKKSKFVAVAAPVDSPSQAMAFVRANGDAKASHNCFAYKIGQSTRSSDDGEPGGTAGMPMLSAIEGSGFDNVAVLVTRYYGGTQLGAGGLVRAYGGAAAKALEGAPSKVTYPVVDALIDAPSFADLGGIYNSMEAHGAVKEDEEFCDDGGVHVQVTVERRRAKRLGDALRDATQGRARYRVLDD
jgi:uncharacterized YigZ family protein